MKCSDEILGNIKAIISDKGIKKNYVARQLGMTSQDFSNILNKRKMLRVEHIPTIAKALEVTPNDLFQN